MTPKIDILIFGAHPDDIELGCGGTILNEIEKGKTVGLVDLTAGELGTRGSVEKRKQESDKASKILGVDFRLNLGMKDGFIKNDENSQYEIIKLIRKYQPDIIICNAPDDRHIDHQKAAKLVIDACFLSGLKKIKTSFEGNLQDVWRPVNVYHYIQWKEITPDIVFDISGFLDKKIEAINAYASQFYDEKSDEPATPISSKNFLDSVRYRAQNLGRLAGVDAAEGFTVERTPLITNFDQLH